MSDLIRRSDVIDAIRGEREYLIARGQMGAEHVLAKHADAVIDSIPAVDAVEVCRCADCKHWERYVHDRGDDSRCGFHNRQIGRDGYCAWGQRREDGDE